MWGEFSVDWLRHNVSALSLAAVLFVPNELVLERVV